MNNVIHAPIPILFFLSRKKDVYVLHLLKITHASIAKLDALTAREVFV